VLIVLTLLTIVDQGPTKCIEWVDLPEARPAAAARTRIEERKNMVTRERLQKLESFSVDETR
jgi:hypothetical protein